MFKTVSTENAIIVDSKGTKRLTVLSDVTQDQHLANEIHFKGIFKEIIQVIENNLWTSEIDHSHQVTEKFPDLDHQIVEGGKRDNNMTDDPTGGMTGDRHHIHNATGVGVRKETKVKKED